MGRKKKENKQKENAYRVILTDGEYKLIQHASDTLGFPSVSSYIKACALGKINATREAVK